MLRRHRLLCVSACAATLSAGCGRITASTEVKPDGSYVRRIVFRAPAVQEGAPGGLSGPSIDEVFALPTAPAWTVARSTEEGEAKVTAERTVAAGAGASADITVRTPGKTPAETLLTNSVEVRRVAPNRWEYRETIRWTGPPSEITDAISKDAEEWIAKALPAGVSTPELAKGLASSARNRLWRVLFGPGDPLFLGIIAHPDLAERRLLSAVAREMNAVLVEILGDRLSAEQRRAAIRALTTEMQTVTKVRGQARQTADKGPAESNFAGLMPLLSSVKMPGKIVATNGEWDEASGEVIWGMYGQAAALEPVVLTATCEIGN